MTETISVQIKNLNKKIADNSDKYALYEIEPTKYDSNDYSWLKIEYFNDTDLEKIEVGKTIKIEVDKARISGEGNTLLVKGGEWNADKTVWQKVKDTSNKGGEKVGKACKKCGTKLEELAGEGKLWWVLPAVGGLAVGIGLVLIFGFIFGAKKKKQIED